MQSPPKQSTTDITYQTTSTTSSSSKNTTSNPNKSNTLKSIMEELGVRTQEAKTISNILSQKDDSWLITMVEQDNQDQFMKELGQDFSNHGLMKKIAFESVKRWVQRSSNNNTSSPLTSYSTLLLTTSSPKKSSHEPFSTTQIPSFIMSDHHHHGIISAIDFSPDGKLIFSAGEDGRVGVWSTANGQHVKWMEGHSTWVNCVSVSRRGDYISSAGNSAELFIWTFDSLTKNRQLSTSTSQYSSSSLTLVSRFDETGHFLASGYDSGVVIVHRVPEEKPTVQEQDWPILYAIQPHSGEVTTITFIPPSNNDTRLRLVSGSYDKSLKCIDILSGEIIQSYEDHTDHIMSVVYSPQYGLISCCWDGSIVHWNINGEMIKRIHYAHGGPTVRSLAFHDSLLASVGNDGTIRLWKFPEMKLINSLRRNRNSLCVCFSPSGEWLASGEDDGTIKMWSEHSSG
jgi:WD40 repeat protein